VTIHQQRLPNLVVIGAPKAGTTSLFEYLAQHPDIHPAKVKQTAFFKSSEADADLAAQEYARYFRGAGDTRWVMEATPGYFARPDEVIPRMQRLLGSPRLIVSLREPVGRLASHYRMRARAGSSAVPTTLQGFLEPLLNASAATSSPAARMFSAGAYAQHLPAWRDAFGDDLKTIFFDDLVADPGRVVRELCDWLDIDTEAARNFDYLVRNQGLTVRSQGLARGGRAIVQATAPILQRHPGIKGNLRRLHALVNGRGADRGATLTDDQRDQLAALYAPLNDDLAQQLRAEGRTLPGWLEPEGRSASAKSPDGAGTRP
jgi:hypothetical protein